MNAISYASGRFAPGNENLAIWLRNEPTDTAATKSFSRTGGFKGTAVNATYIVKRLTAEFGPVGHGWGVDVVAEDIFEGAPVRADNGTLLGNEKVHRLRVRFWWLDPKSGQKCGFDQMGQTTFVGRNKNGWFTDEEAPKKSLTDALTKAASWLGFAGDIHLGLWDDNRYVAERQQAEQAPPPHSVWTILSRDGVGHDCGNRDKFLSEWRVKISAVAKANKPVDKRVATLRAMEQANEPAFLDLTDEDHADVVETVRGLIHKAIDRLAPQAEQAAEPAEAVADEPPPAVEQHEPADAPADEPPPFDDVPFLDDGPAITEYPISTAKGRKFYDSAEAWVGAWRELIGKCVAAKALDRLAAASEMNASDFMSVESFDAGAVAQVRDMILAAIGGKKERPAPAEPDKVREWTERMVGEISRAQTNPRWWREKSPAKVAKLKTERPELYAMLEQAEADRVAELVTGAEA